MPGLTECNWPIIGNRFLIVKIDDIRMRRSLVFDAGDRPTVPAALPPGFCALEYLVLSDTCLPLGENLLQTPPENIIGAFVWIQ
jgi:hypothetical protein